MILTTTLNPRGRADKNTIASHHSLHSSLIFCVLFREIVCPIHSVMHHHLFPLHMFLIIILRPTNTNMVAYISTATIFVYSLSSSAFRFCCLQWGLKSLMRSQKTHSTSDRSISLSLQRRVSKSSILVGQLVHRVRLGDVHAKLAMRRGGKRQHQVSIIIHQEEAVVLKQWGQRASHPLIPGHP